MKKKILIVSICVLLLLGCVAHVAAVSEGFEWPFSTAKENCAHEYTAIVSVEATCTDAGEVVYSCNKCGHSTKQSQEAFGHPAVLNGKCVLCDQPVSASEGLEYESSTEGDGYVVTGIGTCTDTTVVIPEMYNGEYVVKIGVQAFKGCANIKSVVIPEYVTTIGSEAFANCKALETVTFPSDLERIDDEAFLNCVNLSGIELPEGLEHIGKSAFKYCLNIATELVIPGSVTEIGEGAFFACYHIQTLKIGSGNKPIQIAQDAFFCCIDLKTLILPERLTSVGDWSFFGCKNIEAVHFGGTEQQWQAITFGSRTKYEWDENVAADEIHYNSEGPIA